MARGRKKAARKPAAEKADQFPIPSDVEYINVRIPVYTGEVREDTPIRLESVTLKLLSRAHKRGVNRVHMAIRQMAKRDETLPIKEKQFPPYMNSRTECARYVFALIDQAFKEQVETSPGP
jgi:hypothetical protein